MGDSLQLRVLQKAFDDPFSQSLPAMFGMNNNVAHPCKGRMIGHRPRKANLLVIAEEAEAERVLDGFLHRTSRSVRRPITVAQETCDRVDIQTSLIVGQNIVTVALLHTQP